MLKRTALKHFGESVAALARVAGISNKAVYQWGEVVPYASAIKLAENTGGAIAVDRSLYDGNLKPIRRGAVA